MKLEKRVLTTKNLYEQREKEIKNIGKTGYNIDNYSDLLKEEKEIEIMEVKIDSGLNNFNNQIKNLENSEFCPVCKRAMEDINNTKEIQEIKKLIKKLDIEKEKGGQKILKVRKNLDKEKQLKSNFDEVEKIKITLSRIEIDLERWGLEIQKKNDLIGKYNSHIKDINNNISIEEKKHRHNR